MIETETFIPDVIKLDKKTSKKDMSWTSFFITLAFIIIFRVFVLEPHNVSGSSMDDTFKDGDYVIVDKISYRFKNPEKGDVIVFNPPASVENKSRFIKRVIATPTETIEVLDGKTYINKKVVTEDYVKYKSPKTSASTFLDDNQYFVMGDNRYVSFDSRYWGPIVKDEIQGRVLLRLYPFNKIAFFPGAKEYSGNK
ncbi:signal peptidase I [Arenimonas sp.]|nr:signal peptidase I [Candidatus Parcubacteria bacterium]